MPPCPHGVLPSSPAPPPPVPGLPPTQPSITAELWLRACAPSSLHRPRTRAPSSTRQTNPACRHVPSPTCHAASSMPSPRPHPCMHAGGRMETSSPRCPVPDLVFICSATRRTLAARGPLSYHSVHQSTQLSEHAPISSRSYLQNAATRSWHVYLRAPLSDLGGLNYRGARSARPRAERCARGCRAEWPRRRPRVRAAPAASCASRAAPRASS